MASIFGPNTLKITPISLKKFNSFHCCAVLNEKCEKMRELLFAPVQIEKPKKTRKVSVIGSSGNVGKAVSYNFLLKKLCDELVLFDVPEYKKELCGEVLDLQHAGSIKRHPKVVMCTDLTNTNDSDVIIMCSGKPTTKGQSRLDLTHVNIEIYKKLVPTLAALSPDAVFLILANPIDILSYATWRYSGFDKNRILGTGTELDSARFRYFLGKRLGISPRSVNAYIIGEHGDSSVPVWSTVNVAGTRLREIDCMVGKDDDPGNWNCLHDQVVQAGEVVRSLKGSTNWAISIVAQSIATSVLRNSRRVHTVSTLVKGIYGINFEIFLSLPCVIGNRGVVQVVKQCLEKDELEKLKNAAQTLECVKQTVKW